MLQKLFKDGTQEIGIEKPANILKHPIFYALPVVLGLFLYFLSQSSLLSGDLFGTQSIADSIEEKKQQAGTPDQQPGYSGQTDPLADYLLVGIINSKKIFKSKTDGSILVTQ